MASPVLPPTTWPSPRLVYHRRYNINAFGLNGCIRSTAENTAVRGRNCGGRLGGGLNRFHVKPPRQISQSELLTVHAEAYLHSLRQPDVIARCLEIPQLRRAPGWLADWLILRPMRWATMGTIIAARELQHGLAINLSGGYHHASSAMGHGFSVYADTALAISDLRSSGRLGETDKVVYVDLDAHQGDGVCRTFMNDRRVFIYDQYNRDIFPQDLRARWRIDCDVPLPIRSSEAEYFAELRSKLPLFLDSLTKSTGVRLAIYNAGTDVYAEDQLGMLKVSAPGVLERDQFVLQELITRRIPTVVLLSGGYSRESYRFVADMARYVLQTWGVLPTRRA